MTCVLRAFAKLRKAAISFVRSSFRLSVCLSPVCPSVRTQQLGSHRTDFYEIRHLNIFRKSVQKMKISEKSLDVSSPLCFMQIRRG